VRGWGDGGMGGGMQVRDDCFRIRVCVCVCVVWISCVLLVVCEWEEEERRE